MSVAMCLLPYSVVVAVLGSPLLVRSTHGGIAPRLGVATWVAALASVVLSWAAAAVFLLLELVRTWNQPGWSVINSCFSGLRDLVSGRAGVAIQVGLLVLAVLAVLAVMVVVWRLGCRVLRMRSHTHGHAQRARIIGRRVAGLDALIVEAPERAAYCVAGRPHAIVVTSAAMDALDGPQLEAVLAHERAHLTGRHHQLLAVLRGLAASLPRMALFTIGAVEVARLLEMCADDDAVRAHGPRSLLEGLIALSGAGPIPGGALAATSIAVLDRAGRLASPPRPAELARMRTFMTAIIVLMAVGPVVTAMMASTGMVMCGLPG
ncbi:M56 family metallopeptidase [Rhodococcus opacus]|uniref:M56 family metallopeptidase n=1 Tax=Rhodococcus opacus TaxID=37919 RepID=UPI0029C1D62C|nr:M56 family metallopeptidase [Rhodococcus opacus]MDX5961867.1 M56 family metallopeptidase [Rhodococcus opacus]